jgi:hypothetical protein
LIVKRFKALWEIAFKILPGKYRAGLRKIWAFILGLKNEHFLAKKKNSIAFVGFSYSFRWRLLAFSTRFESVWSVLNGV